MAELCPLPAITKDYERRRAELSAFEACMSRQHGPRQIDIKPYDIPIPQKTLAIRAHTPQEAITKLITSIQSGSEFGEHAVAAIKEHEALAPKELFPGALALADLAVTAGSAGIGASTPLAVSKLLVAEATGMSLNIPQLLSGIGGAIGGINLGAVAPYTSTLGNLLTAGGNIAAAFTPPAVGQTVQAYAPVYSPPAVVAAPAPVYQATPVGLPIAAAAGAIARITLPVLSKISAKLGLRRILSLDRAMAMIRKMGKLITDPSAIAVALGITTAELATLITASTHRKRRRMNPANGHALRRAARRIKSFHRLCTHTDLLKTRSKPRKMTKCSC